MLLGPVGSKYVLPSVQVQRQGRFSECLTAGARDLCGCEVICLFSQEAPVRTSATSEIRYHVVQCCEDSASPNHRFEWIPFTKLSANLMVESAEHQLLRQSLETWKSFSNGLAPGVFAKPGWFEELRSWAAEAVRPLGYRLERGFRQVNASPRFSLIRLETSGPAIWFKAVGEPNLREFAISNEVAQFAPCFIPTIIAVRPEWKSWLALEAAGGLLQYAVDIEIWTRAAAAFAELQIQSIGSRSQLLKAGARDIRVSTLARILPHFLDTICDLMEQQTKSFPSALSRKEIGNLGDQIAEGLSLMEKRKIPDVLGHLDLNAENVIYSPQGCVFLDWAEGCVGPPFFSFSYLLEHFRHVNGENPKLEAMLLQAYAQPWRMVLSEGSLADVLPYVPLLSAFAYATQAGERMPLNSNVAAYLRSLTRRMKYEADQFVSGRSTCLQ